MYNEGQIKTKTAKALYSAMEDYCSQKGASYEIIFSDDGSTDGCSDTLYRISHELEFSCGRIDVVRSETNRGKGAAVRRGVMASHGDIIIYTDCDLAYGTKVIGDVCDRFFENDSEIIIGSRKLHPDGYDGYTILRKAASKVYLKVLSLFAGFKLSDSQCGFKAFKGDIAKDLFASSSLEGWSFDFEILMLAQKRGYEISEMPVKIVNHRESKIHMIKDSFKMLSDIYRIRRNL